MSNESHELAKFNRRNSRKVPLKVGSNRHSTKNKSDQERKRHSRSPDSNKPKRSRPNESEQHVELTPSIKTQSAPCSNALVSASSITPPSNVTNPTVNQTTSWSSVPSQTRGSSNSISAVPKHTSPTASFHSIPPSPERIDVDRSVRSLTGHPQGTCSTVSIERDNINTRPEFPAIHQVESEEPLPKIPVDSPRKSSAPLSTSEPLLTLPNCRLSSSKDLSTQTVGPRLQAAKDTLPIAVAQHEQHGSHPKIHEISDQFHRTQRKELAAHEVVLDSTISRDNLTSTELPPIPSSNVIEPPIEDAKPQKDADTLNSSRSVESLPIPTVDSKEREFRHYLLLPTAVPRGGCGLTNLGNTCFMNSALQCLSNASNLTEHILQVYISDSSNIYNRLGNQGSVASAYADLVYQMWSGTETFTSASDVKRHVGELSRRFAGFSQQDSHEFLNVLLGALHEDLKRESPDAVDTEETSLISDIFHGKLRSTVNCFGCNQPVYMDDSMSFLALPIPNDTIPTIRRGNTRKGSKSTVTLTDCLLDFFKPEILSENGQWFCNECNGLHDAEKKLDLWMLPKILIIQLKRFTYDLRNNTKIGTKVIYPRIDLDLSAFVTNPEYDPSTRYDLVAVSVHTGSLAGGHYTAYAKNFLTQKWYHFNDENVRDATEEEIVTANAYVLVYQRR